uniref:Uncharacterized protein n=1 Tax=Equus asinus TaxID=9793 RepID=A0A9L0IE33_EQUAS
DAAIEWGPGRPVRHSGCTHSGGAGLGEPRPTPPKPPPRRSAAAGVRRPGSCSLSARGVCRERAQRPEQRFICSGSSFCSHGLHRLHPAQPLPPQRRPPGPAPASAGTTRSIAAQPGPGKIPALRFSALRPPAGLPASPRAPAPAPAPSLLAACSSLPFVANKLCGRGKGAGGGASRPKEGVGSGSARGWESRVWGREWGRSRRRNKAAGAHADRSDLPDEPLGSPAGRAAPRGLAPTHASFECGQLRGHTVRAAHPLRFSRFRKQTPPAQGTPTWQLGPTNFYTLTLSLTQKLSQQARGRYSPPEGAGGAAGLPGLLPLPALLLHSAQATPLTLPSAANLRNCDPVPPLAPPSTPPL